MGYLGLLLHTVQARNTHFEKSKTLFSVKIFKTTFCLGGGGYSILIALNLENFWVKIQNRALLLDFLALFLLYYTHTLNF